MFDLVVIESPNKSRKVSGYAGGARVIATVGHFRDLPEKELGVDRDTMEPAFVTTERGRKVAPELRGAAAGKRVCIATDPDREGYAIGYHAWEEVRKGAAAVFRAEIREITAKGVREALARAVPFESTNLRQYDAFLGRRVADRLAGYLLSPAASRVLGRGYSVGRVQSPAVRLVVEREREIRAFVPEAYWLLEATLRKDGTSFKALHGAGRFTDPEAAKAALSRVEPAPFATVTAVEEKVTRQSPRPPFTTSDLMATASAKLRLPTDRTMKLAQELFEAALITYHRTDSVRLSGEFVAEARDFIGKAFGAAYLPAAPRQHRSKASQAEAHEAVRPTALHPLEDWWKVVAAEKLSPDHVRLYDLVCRRTLASQMADATFDAVAVSLDIAGEPFRAKGRTPRFAGYLAVYGEEEERKARKETEGGAPPEDDLEEQGALPRLSEGESVRKTGAALLGRETRPPGRYSEGTLVKALEKLGIGRPSTWATIVGTVKRRQYVEVQKGKLAPTARGERIVDYLLARHGWVVDYAMTAGMEKRLDEVEEGKGDWRAFCREVLERCSAAGGGAAPGGGTDAAAGGDVPGTGEDGPPRPPRDDTPTAKQLDYARDLAWKHGTPLPEETVASKRLLGAWIDEVLAAHPRKAGEGASPRGKGRAKGGSRPARGASPAGGKMRRRAAAPPSGAGGGADRADGGGPPPSPRDDTPTTKQLSYAKALSERHGTPVPQEALGSRRLLGKWIDEALAARPKGAGEGGAPPGKGRAKGAPRSARGAPRAGGKGGARKAPRSAEGSGGDGAGHRAGGEEGGPSRAPSGRPLSPKQRNVIDLFAPPEVKAKVAGGDTAAGRAFLDEHFGKK